MDCATAFAGPKGHGGEVKSVDWHPNTSLLASGSRDAMVKLWDTRLSPETAMLATLSGHKQAVNKVIRGREGEGQGKAYIGLTACGLHMQLLHVLCAPCDLMTCIGTTQWPSHRYDCRIACALLAKRTAFKTQPAFLNMPLFSHCCFCLHCLIPAAGMLELNGTWLASCGRDFSLLFSAPAVPQSTICPTVNPLTVVLEWHLPSVMQPWHN
jgi:hypothetical protein